MAFVPLLPCLSESVSAPVFRNRFGFGFSHSRRNKHTMRHVWRYSYHVFLFVVGWMGLFVCNKLWGTTNNFGQIRTRGRSATIITGWKKFFNIYSYSKMI